MNCHFCLDCSSLKNPQQVERLQEKAHRALKQYVENRRPNNPERFAKILLRLPATRMLTGRAAEELFFSPLIGAVRIESIMNSIISSSLAMWRSIVDVQFLACLGMYLYFLRQWRRRKHGGGNAATLQEHNENTTMSTKTPTTRPTINTSLCYWLFFTLILSSYKTREMLMWLNHEEVRLL